MLTVKKIQALVETILWLIAVVVMICFALPIGGVLSFAGFVLRMFHVDFMSDIAVRFMNMVIAFVQFVTRRIRMRTHEIEALRAKS